MYRVAAGFLASLLIAASVLVGPAHAERRRAFAVGIKDYPNLIVTDAQGRKQLVGQLRTPLDDADTMAAALKTLQFDVTVAKDVTRKDFLISFEKFKNNIQPGDITLFFFAGHGVALQGGNFLLPADIDPPSPNGEQLLRDWAIPEVAIIAGIQSRGAGLIILVLDACRNNPLLTVENEQALADGRPLSSLTRSLPTTISRGLTAPQIPTDVVAIYSAGFGQTALDSLPTDRPEQKNSVFVRVFANKIKQPGLSLGELMPDVQAEVGELAAKFMEPDGPHRQTPAFLSQTSKRIYLAGLPPPAKPVPVTPPPPALDEQMWNAVKDAKVAEVFDEFCRLFPDSRHVAEARARSTALKRSPVPAPVHQEVNAAPAPVRSKNVQCDAVSLDRLSAAPHAFDEIQCTCFKLNCPAGPTAVRKSADVSAPASPPTRMMRVYEGRDLEGSDLKAMPNQNFAQCISACKDNGKCSSFSYDKWNRYCFLKDVVPSEIRLEPKSIIAVMSNTAPALSSAPISIERYRNSQFNDAPFKQIVNSSYDDCASACSQDKRCEVFSIINASKVCRLIEHPTEYVRGSDVDADSGVKRQLPTPAGSPPTAAAVPTQVGGPLVPVGGATQLSIWSHNGSLMTLDADGISRRFKYYQPRDGLDKAGISTGTMLFNGEKDGKNYIGVAYTFSSRCGRFSFDVTGPVSDDLTAVTMTGQKPKLDYDTCTVIGQEPETLVFEFQYKK